MLKERKKYECQDCKKQRLRIVMVKKKLLKIRKSLTKLNDRIFNLESGIREKTATIALQLTELEETIEKC